jgi:hypothetical protein
MLITACNLLSQNNYHVIESYTFDHKNFNQKGIFDILKCSLAFESGDYSYINEAKAILT